MMYGFGLLRPRKKSRGKPTTCSLCGRGRPPPGVGGLDATARCTHSGKPDSLGTWESSGRSTCDVTVGDERRVCRKSKKRKRGGIARTTPLSHCRHGRRFI